MGDLTLSLPSGLAAELTREGLAREVIVWRGVDVVTVLTLAADITSAVTAVVASRQAFAEIARRLVHHASAEAGDALEVSISVKNAHGVRVLIETNDTNGLAKLAVRVDAVIEDADQDRQNGVERPLQ
jgi:hypothetical protein